MYVHVHSGLMSRCVTLAHAYSLVKSGYNKELTIVWPKDDECAIGYKDIFSKEQFSDIPVRVIEYTESVNGGVRKNLSEKRIFCAIRIELIKIFERMPYALKKKKKDFIKANKWIDYDPPKEIGYCGDAYTEYTLNTWLSCKEKLEEREDIYIYAYCGILQGKEAENIDFSSIHFKEEYYKDAEQIVTGANPWVGIHIRRTDHKPATVVSNTELFIDNMKRILQEMPDTKFFLATDDKEIEHKLYNEFYPKVVIQQGKTWGRDNKKGMKSGIIDSLCLSKCDYILGSYMSVFSSFSAGYGKKKLIICKNNM